MSTAVELRGISRSFGDLRALDDVTLSLPTAQVTGVLGHNGAGKTTLVRVLNGLLQPDSGAAVVLGHDPTVDGAALRARTGVVSETAGLDELLTVRENLSLRAHIAGLAAPAVRRRTETVLEELGLADLVDRRVQGLSSGQRQRVSLARALVTQPELLFLDEPTSNMDPIASRQVYDLMERHRLTGGTVVLCTHELQEAARVCDRIVVLERGHVLATGSTSELTARVGLRPEVWVRSTAEGADRLMTVIGGAETDAVGRRLDACTVEITPLLPDEVPSFVAWLVGQDIPVAAVTPRQPTLEDAYLALHHAGPTEAPA